VAALTTGAAVPVTGASGAVVLVTTGLSVRVTGPTAPVAGASAAVAVVAVGASVWVTGASDLAAVDVGWLGTVVEGATA
jgi:hypothetical protein